MAWEMRTTDWITHEPVGRTYLVGSTPFVYAASQSKASFAGDPLEQQPALTPQVGHEVSVSWPTTEVAPQEGGAVSIETDSNLDLYAVQPVNPDKATYFESGLTSFANLQLVDSDGYSWCNERGDILLSEFVAPEGGEFYASGIEWEGWESGELLGAYSNRVLEFGVTDWQARRFREYYQDGDVYQERDASETPPAPTSLIQAMSIPDLEESRYGYDPAVAYEYTNNYLGNGLDLSIGHAFQWKIGQMRLIGANIGVVPGDAATVSIPISDSFFESSSILLYRQFEYTRVTRMMSLTMPPNWEDVLINHRAYRGVRQFTTTPRVSATYQPPRYRISYQVFIEDPEPPAPVPQAGEIMGVRRRFNRARAY